MDKDELKKRIDDIIAVSKDDERAHAEEDKLHLEIIQVLCPEWVVKEVERLRDADFARWCA